MLIVNVDTVEDLKKVMKAPFASPEPTNPVIQESFAYWSQRVREFALNHDENIQFLIELNELNNLSRSGDEAG
jgi:hypothetical protein